MDALIFKLDSIHQLGTVTHSFTLKTAYEHIRRMKPGERAKFDKIYFTIDGVLYCAEKVQGAK